MQKVSPMSESEIPSTPQIVEIQGVLDKLEDRLMDINQFYQYASTNSLNIYYKQIVNDIVLDLTIMPVTLARLELEPIDDANSVNAGIQKMSSKLSWVFNKSQTQVELDIYNKMSNYPVDDTRKSQWLQHTHMLN